jgi:cyclopropane fatty-acyl-phospholipid synthase-like methyltransferase
MRNAAEFNAFYAEPDPWHISRAKFRDKILRRSVHKFVTGKSVLELGCGEGHLTQTIFDGAKTVTGIDLSDVAIERAKACAIPNARFENADFLEVSFKGYDVIAAIECLYYLTPDDQETFFEKVACDHRGKPLILSGPIIGSNEFRKYFTDESLRKTFARHGLSVMASHNLNVYRRGAMANLAAGLVRLPLCGWLLDYLPRRLIYQRLYAVA